MISKEEIREVAKVKIKELDAYLVDVKVTTSNVITIYIDRLDGVLVEHCLEVSKYIEENFS